ncbi:MAG: HXXEE domain-containing protein [Rhodospirillales bacterium]|nr:HXXEE domain-containing protein [Rhodospirillales bacterium]
MHQFEEHGIDVNGAEYAFREFLCGFFGFADLKSCPLLASVITAVNVAAVWLLGPAATLLGRRWPLVALSFFSVPSVNFVAHAASAVMLFGRRRADALRMAPRPSGTRRKAP